MPLLGPVQLTDLCRLHKLDPSTRLPGEHVPRAQHPNHAVPESPGVRMLRRRSCRGAAPAACGLPPPLPPPCPPPAGGPALSPAPFGPAGLWDFFFFGLFLRWTLGSGGETCWEAALVLQALGEPKSPGLEDTGTPQPSL